MGKLLQKFMGGGVALLAILALAQTSQAQDQAPRCEFADNSTACTNCFENAGSDKIEILKCECKHFDVGENKLFTNQGQCMQELIGRNQANGGLIFQGAVYGGNVYPTVYEAMADAYNNTLVANDLQNNHTLVLKNYTGLTGVADSYKVSIHGIPNGYDGLPELFDPGWGPPGGCIHEDNFDTPEDERNCFVAMSAGACAAATNQDWCTFNSQCNKNADGSFKPCNATASCHIGCQRGVGCRELTASENAAIGCGTASICCSNPAGCLVSGTAPQDTVPYNERYGNNSGGCD